jgi:hypothetical protein
LLTLILRNPDPLLCHYFTSGENLKAPTKVTKQAGRVHCLFCPGHLKPGLYVHRKKKNQACTCHRDISLHIRVRGAPYGLQSFSSMLPFSPAASVHFDDLNVHFYSNVLGQWQVTRITLYRHTKIENKYCTADDDLIPVCGTGTKIISKIREKALLLSCD